MEVNETNIKSLLAKVSTVVDEYNKKAAETGENFNIFSILKIPHRETIVHTPIIKELLDPNGSHGKNFIFLTHFLEIIKERCPAFFLEEITSVHTKVLTEKRYESGQVDIQITFNKEFNIIIENKINAGDGEGQLFSYYEEHCKNNKGILFYLTLDGRDAANHSIEKDGRKMEGAYYKLSYKKDILDWLIKCKQTINKNSDTENDLVISTLLQQYINLIKSLTNQNSLKKMSNELFNLFTNNKDNIEAARIIAEEWENSMWQIIQNIGKTVGEELKLDFKFDKGKGFWFKKTDWNNCIAFYFPSSSSVKEKYKTAAYGIAKGENGAWISREEYEAWTDMSWSDRMENCKKIFKDFVEETIRKDETRLKTE